MNADQKKNFINLVDNDNAFVFTSSIVIEVVATSAQSLIAETIRLHKDQIDDTTGNLCCTDNGKKDISIIENCHSNKLIYNKDKNDKNNNDK